MDSIRPSPAPNRSLLSRTFHKVLHRKASTCSSSSPPPPPKPMSGNAAFCLLIPQEKLKCCEPLHLGRDEILQECREISRNKAAMEAFVAKLFAAISSLKAAYAELQISQFPYNSEAVQSADLAVVGELKSISELKRRFLKNQVDSSSPPHVSLMISEIQEQQSLMKTYEITMRKMQGEIERKTAAASSLRSELGEIAAGNKSLEGKMSAGGGSFDGVEFSDVNTRDFVAVLQYAVRSVRHFVKHLVRSMEAARWDIDGATAAIHRTASFRKKSHRAFAFESFVCRGMLAGFEEPCFSVQSDPCSSPEKQRNFFFDQFKLLRSAGAVHFLKQNPSSPFARFVKAKYLHLVHPKMEYSFSGNLTQRKTVNSGDFPETEFFGAFAEMGRRVWLLHCLALSFDRHVGVFQVRKGAKFSEVYMESVTDEGPGEFRAAFTVVPGFTLGKMVVQSQVYLSPVRN